MHDRVVKFVGSRTRDHDNIAHFGEKVLIYPKYFSYQSLYSVSSNRVAHLLGYRNSKSPAFRIGPNQEYEVFGMNFQAVALDAKILGPSTNAIVAPKGVLLEGINILVLFLGHAKPRRWELFSKVLATPIFDSGESQRR